MKKRFTMEEKLIAQVRYYEKLHVIRDERGETLFVGSLEMGRKFLKMLNADARKGKKK